MTIADNVEGFFEYEMENSGQNTNKIDIIVKKDNKNIDEGEIRVADLESYKTEVKGGELIDITI